MKREFTDEQKKLFADAISKARVGLSTISDVDLNDVVSIQLLDEEKLTARNPRMSLITKDGKEYSTSLLGIAGMTIWALSNGPTKEQLKAFVTTRDFRSSSRVMTLKDYSKHKMDQGTTALNFEFKCVAKVPRVNVYAKGTINEDGRCVPAVRYQSFVYEGHADYLAALAGIEDDEERFRVMQIELPKLLASGIADSKLATEDNVMYTPIFTAKKV
jgi:hypothetical protein